MTHYDAYQSDRFQTPGPVKIQANHFSYHEIPLEYEGTDFILEGCEMEAPKGLQTSTRDNCKTEHKIFTILDHKKPTCIRFIDTIDNIYIDSVNMINHFKDELQLKHFNRQNTDCFFKNFLRYPQDHCTRKIIPNSAPSMYLKLVFNENNLEQTIFTDQEGKFIAWNELVAVKFTFIPKIHIKSIYVGYQCSFRIEVPNATITSIHPM
jgi:hypothetical protein